MSADVMVATAVQIMDEPSTVISGTAERRLKRMILEGPKATQADWFLLSSYISTAECANIFSIHVNADAETLGVNDPVVDTFTYTSADYKLVCAGSITGIARAEVLYWTE